MSTEKEFTSIARAIDTLAEAVKPIEGEKRHFEIRSLIVYHLRSAASKARAVAEDLSKDAV